MRARVDVYKRQGEDLPVQVLEDQGHHEVFGLILLGQHDKDGGLLIAELLRVNSRIKAEDLLHLRVKESVETGQHLSLIHIF